MYKQITYVCTTIYIYIYVYIYIYIYINIYTHVMPTCHTHTVHVCIPTVAVSSCSPRRAIGARRPEAARLEFDGGQAAVQKHNTTQSKHKLE